MNYFVMEITAEAKCGRLIGPGTWDQCVSKIWEVLKSRELNPEDFSDEEKTEINENGSYEDGDGSGIYIICANDINDPIPSEDE